MLNNEHSVAISEPSLSFDKLRVILRNNTRSVFFKVLLFLFIALLITFLLEKCFITKVKLT